MVVVVALYLSSALRKKRHNDISIGVAGKAEVPPALQKGKILIIRRYKHKGENMYCCKCDEELTLSEMQEDENGNLYCRDCWNVRGCEDIFDDKFIEKLKKLHKQQ